MRCKEDIYSAPVDDPDFDLVKRHSRSKSPNIVEKKPSEEQKLPPKPVKPVSKKDVPGTDERNSIELEREKEHRRGMEKALERKVSNVTNIFAKNKAR